MLHEVLVRGLLRNARIKVRGIHTAVHGTRTAIVYRAYHAQYLIGATYEVLYPIKQRNLHHTNGLGVLDGEPVIQPLTNRRVYDCLQTACILTCGKRTTCKDVAAKSTVYIEHIVAKGLSDELVGRRSRLRYLAREHVQVHKMRPLCNKHARDSGLARRYTAGQ